MPRPAEDVDIRAKSGGPNDVDGNTATLVQHQALIWALDLVLDDQSHYLKTGNPDIDYEDEWAAVANTKADLLQALAELCKQMGAGPMARDFRKLARDFRKSGKAAAKEGPDAG